MVINDFNGKSICTNLSELYGILAFRSKNNSNDIEMKSDSGYPCLTILIKNEWACVHYFEDENHCGYYAYLDDNDTDINSIVFNMGSEMLETEISSDLIIPIKKAYTIASDFFQNCSMSKEIKWFEL